MEGSIKDLSSVKILLDDILLLDIGEKAYTSYDNMEELMNYWDEYPEKELLFQEGKLFIGHVH